MQRLEYLKLKIVQCNYYFCQWQESHRPCPAQESPSHRVCLPGPSSLLICCLDCLQACPVTAWSSQPVEQPVSIHRPISFASNWPRQVTQNPPLWDELANNLHLMDKYTSKSACILVDCKTTWGNIYLGCTLTYPFADSWATVSVQSPNQETWWGRKELALLNLLQQWT